MVDLLRDYFAADPVADVVSLDGMLDSEIVLSRINLRLQNKA
jgi:hypothetical protein